MLKELTGLGLSEDEAQVYLAMLELGGGYVSQIAKKAGKHRATCYHTLNNLLEKGLSSKLEKGKYIYYSPEEPNKLVQQMANKLSAAQSLLPELLSIQNTLARKPKIKFYEGISGIETIFEDTLTAQSEILGYTNLSSLLRLFPEYFKKYSKKKMKNNIKTRYLSPRPDETLKDLDSFFQKQADSDLLEILFINPEEFPFNNEIAIYENKVAIMSLSEDEKIAILIESQVFSNTMKAIFDLSWLGATSFIAQ